MAPQRLNVLQASFSCDPCASMESRLSWARAVESAKEFNTWVVCRPQLHDSMGRRLPERPVVDGLTIVELPPTRYEQWLTQSPFGFYAAYHRYQAQVLKIATRLHREIGFDLTHQVSFCGYREPGYLWKLDAPFVWGPIGGTQNCPAHYGRILGTAGHFAELARNVVNEYHLRYRRRVRQAAHSAAHIFAANTQARDDFQRTFGIETELQLETGLTQLPDWKFREQVPGQPLRILWSGRFCPWKAFPLLIEALAPLRGTIPFEVRVLGYGPLKSRWQRLIQAHGLEQHVTICPWPTYEDSMSFYDWADVTVFTSLRDTSGTGVLESLAHGCPIIGMNHQGAKDIVTDDSGIRISVSNPEESIAEIRAAITTLANSPDELKRLSHGARQRAHDYLWSGLGERMRQVYRDVVRQHSDESLRSESPRTLSHWNASSSSEMGIV